MSKLIIKIRVFMQEVHSLGLGVSDFVVLLALVVGVVVSISEIILHYKNLKALTVGLGLAVSTLILPSTMAIYLNYLPKGNYTAHTITKGEVRIVSKEYTFKVLEDTLQVDGLEYLYNKQRSNPLVRVYISKTKISSITVTLMGNIQYHNKDTRELEIIEVNT